MQSWGWPLSLSGGPYAPPTLGSSTEERSCLSGPSLGWCRGCTALSGAWQCFGGYFLPVGASPDLPVLTLVYVRMAEHTSLTSKAQFSVWGDEELGSAGDARAHTDLPASPGLGHAVLSGGHWAHPAPSGLAEEPQTRHMAQGCTQRAAFDGSLTLLWLPHNQPSRPLSHPAGPCASQHLETW